MNLPNRLTLFRIILVPVFVIFMMVTERLGEWNYLIALIIFVVASLTDLFDGRIARKRNLITDFGKFMDPLADKLLVCSALICLLSIGLIPAWALVIIIGREFVISGFRLIAAEHQIVIAAGIWGKLKTVFQMVSVILFLVSLSLNAFIGESLSGTYTAMEWFQVIVLFLALVTFYICVVLTVISMIDYIVKNREVFKQQD